MFYVVIKFISFLINVRSPIIKANVNNRLIFQITSQSRGPLCTSRPNLGYSWTCSVTKLITYLHVKSCFEWHTASYTHYKYGLFSITQVSRLRMLINGW